MRAFERGSVALAVVAVVAVAALGGCLGSVVDANATDSSPARATTVDAPEGGTLSVHFIHVGQGTSVLVAGPAGETLLYDTGNWRDGGAHVLDYLRARNVTRIDYLVTSHADADHVGGHAAVIDYYEREAAGVGAIYDPGIAAGTRTYEAYLDAVERHDVTLYRAQSGDAIPLAGASVRVLAPPEGYLADRERNENSLALAVTFGNASVLLPGDVGPAGEHYLTDARAGALNATVLGVAHHGSNTSTGPGFLAATTPRVAVIQSAFDSPYGHPHRAVLARLAARGIPTYWTGVHGDVVVETDGRNAVVRTQRDAPTAPLELRSAPGVDPDATGLPERRATFAVGGAGEGESATRGSDSGTAVPDGSEAPTTHASPPADALELAAVHADARGDDREHPTTSTSSSGTRVTGRSTSRGGPCATPRATATRSRTGPFSTPARP